MFHRLFILFQVLLCKAIDIWSTSKYPANVLSNLAENHFVIDGVKCASMEGFLQSLKYRDDSVQQKICMLSGGDAKKMSTANWQSSQTVWWQGREIHRQSVEYYQFIKRAYKELFEQNEQFRTALKRTVGKRLYHSRGSQDYYYTILTEQEFIRILNEMRESL